MGSRVRLHAILYSFVLAPAGSDSCAAGTETLTYGSENAPALLLLYVHSILLNYGQDYLNLGSKFKLDAETRADVGGREARAIVFSRCFGEIVMIVNVLLLVDLDLNVDEMIDLLDSDPEVNGVPIRDYAGRFAHSSKCRVRLSYRFVFLEQGARLTKSELYGLAELDPTYEQASDSVIMDVLDGNVSMIRGIRFYFSTRSATVIYNSHPEGFVKAINNFDQGEIGEVLKRASDVMKVKGWHGVDRAIEAMPFLDYAVEIEVVLVEGGLLKMYEEMLTGSRRTRDEIANIKSRITATLDFYYTARYTKYHGAAIALEAASRAMGIGLIRSSFEDRMRLLGEAIETGHQLAIERWNKLLTYTLAAMTFASIALTFIIAYFHSLLPVITIAAVFSVTVGFLLVIIALYERLAMRKGENDR